MQQGFSFPLSKCVSGILVFVLLANIVLFGVLMAPKRAEAQLPVTDVAAMAQRTAQMQISLAHYWSTVASQTRDTAMASQTTLQYLWEQIKSPWGLLSEIGKALFLVFIHQMLAKTTNDIIAYINGGKGQFSKKVRVMQDPMKFLRDSVDEAGGVLMGTILGVDSRTLCDASFLKLKLAPALLGPYAVPTFNEKVACTFSGMQEGLRKFKEDFRNGGWSAWIEYTQRQNNQIGITLDTVDQLAKMQAKQLEKAKTEAGISEGFMAQKRCIITKGPNIDPEFGIGLDIEEAYISAQDGDRFNSSVKDYQDTDLGTDIIYKPNTSKTQWTGWNNSDEFHGWLITNGGTVECKITTPAKQLSELATLALEAPIRTMEGIVNGLTSNLDGNKVGQVLKPYINAIAGASLNLMLNKEKGLIADAFAPPTKDRNQRPRPSDAVQDNAARASSAGQIASSANGFQAFILKSLVDFSIFVSTTAQVQDSSNELGRLPLNRVEYTRALNKTPSGDIIGGFLNSNTTAKDENADKKLIGNLKGWLTNVDNTQCRAHFNSGNNNFTYYIDVIATSSISIRIATCDKAYLTPGDPPITENISYTDPDTGAVTVTTYTADSSDNPTIIDKMITTYPSGKIFFEEANWCGAYSQETPLQVEVNEDPITSYASSTSGGKSYYLYNDDGTEGDTEIIMDRFMRSVPGFSETFIIPNSDINHDNIVNTATTTIGASNPPVYLGINDLLSLTPNFSGREASNFSDNNNVLGIGGNNIGDTRPIAQPAVALDYTFGGYYGGGFSDEIRGLPGGSALLTELPAALAGAEAIYYPPNNRIYIFGGRNQYGLLNTVYEFDIKNQTVRNMSAHFPKGIYGMTGAYSPDTGRIYLFGGKIGDTHPTTGKKSTPVNVTNASVSDQIFEFNQQADTLVAKNAKLPEPLAHSSAVPLYYDKDKKINIYIFGGIDSYGQASNNIVAYDPKADDDSRAVTRLAKTLKSPRGYLAALPVDDIANINTKNYKGAKARIIGGESTMGRWDVIEEFNATDNSVKSVGTLPGGALSQMGRSLEKSWLVGGIKNSPAGDPGTMIFPQGDIYYIPGTAPAVSRQQPILQKYYSPSYENGSVSLLNIRENRAYKDPTLTVSNPDIMNDIHMNGDEVHMPQDSFYPELNEKIQELMEKLRIIKGYHYKTPNQKDYEAGIAQQVGSTPDDDPYDNSVHNTLYPDRPVPAENQVNCSSPDVWDETAGQCLRKGYKGSVSDVMSRYKNIADIYQSLYSGVNDERVLEGIDKDMTILTPMETNMKLALIGERCPTLRPTATSTPEVAKGCPAYGTNGEYNMAKRFRFAEDDERANPAGITTGFATNPFNNKKSSSLAGILNLDEMATQLQSLPPDKNIVKLVRLRQILEQLQVCEVRDQNGNIARDKNSNPRSCKDTAFDKNLQQVSPPPIRLPGKNEYINPESLEGVDIIKTSLFGFEKIQDWLNSTATSTTTGLALPDRNKNIQELVEAYGYTSAKEAYPEISKDLDMVLQDATNQVMDKVREVFLKRTEENLETSRIEAQYRLKRFVEYARDLGSTVKLGLDGTEARRLGGGLIDTNADQVDNDQYVLRVEAFTSDPKNSHWVDNIIKNSAVDNNQRSGLTGSAIYKIKSLARFIGIDTESVEFTSMITQYTNSVAPKGATPAEISDDINKRLKDSIEDAYLLYRGVSDQTNPDLSNEEMARTADNRCGYADEERAYFCDLNGNGSDGKPIRIYKDASMKLKELENNFDLAIEEFNKIKDDFSQTINDAQSQKQGFEDLLASFTALEGEYNKANACAGMPDVRWHIPGVLESLYSAMGATWTAILGGGLLVATYYIPVVGPIVGAITGWITAKKKKKAEKKYQKQVTKIAEECKTALINYNRKLGQLADSFVCGRTNTMYQEQ